MSANFEERDRLRLQRRRFARARKAETWYGVQLRRIAQQIGQLAGIYNPQDPGSVSQIAEALRVYARIITPWARNTATRVLADIAERDAQAWQEHSRQLGVALRTEIAMAPTGDLMRSLLAEQVSLITSIPLDAAIRVQKLALEGLTEGSRGQDIRDMILASGEVSKSHATLIARTETARVSSLLTQARAEHIGSEGYIWRTAHDADVRELHVELEGKFIYWNAPPVAGSSGERAHAGQIYNCRCWAEVILPALTRTADKKRRWLCVAA